MAIPSEADLLDCSERLLKLHRVDLGEKIYTGTILDVEEVKSLLLANLESITSAGAELGKHPAMAWLIEQPAYKMALPRAFRRGKKEIETNRQWIERTAHHLVDTIRELPPSFTFHRPIDLLRPFTKIERRLAAAFGVPAYYRWHSTITNALAEYHYTDNHKSIAACQRDMPALMLQSKKALTLLAESLQTNYERHSDIFELTAIMHMAERLLRTIERRAPPGAELIYPIKRNDRTARERLFVYRMFSIHTSIFRTPRPDAISMLLDLEGFEHPIDTRNVEKLCAQFKEAKSHHYKNVNAAHKAVEAALKLQT